MDHIYIYIHYIPLFLDYISINIDISLTGRDFWRRRCGQGMGFYDRVLVDKKRGRKRTENGRGDWNFDWKMDEKMDGLEEF